MIYMLSRFDLTPGVDLKQFNKDYHQLVDQMRNQGLVAGTGKIGRRHADTPMDTDAADAPEYYVVMSFETREQLERSYALLTEPAANRSTTHPSVMAAVANPVFTCWQDIE